jgi:aspartate carbamoyltransferase regulatory subunit
MNKLKVDAIRSGTVIDHIPGGAGLKVLQIIGTNGKDVISLGINLASKTQQKKDLVKIEGKELLPEQVNQIALIAPHATINIIRDYKVIEKFSVDIPDAMEGLLVCPNPKCVTNSEKIRTRFKVVDKNPVKLQCCYCERIYAADDVNPRNRGI